MLFYLSSIIFILNYAEAYYVNITHDGSVIIGGTVTLVATLYNDDGSTPEGAFKYIWSDNAFPKHSKEFDIKDNNTCVWTVSYDAETYNPGIYEIEVRVDLHIPIFDWKIASDRVTINITPFLNGDIKIFQNETEISNDYVSNTREILHKVVLSPSDLKFVNKSTNSIQSYWWIDYTYVGTVFGLDFKYNYTKYLYKDVTVSATVIVYQNISNQNNETKLGNLTNEIAAPLKQTVNVSTTPSPLGSHGLSFNVSCIPSDPDKIIGCFHRKLFVREEVSNVRVSGNYWLKHGDMLNLTVTCSGSGPFWHCVKILAGEYNSTGKETCLKATQTHNCSVKVLHYFSVPSEYTLLFIIGNALSKTVTPVRVTIYEVQKHAQLSVIIVPISCSAIAVILIVFGVAYYIQSRNRFIVEVADFDFAQPSSDTEYKTLRERLRDAVSGAINRTQDYVEDSGGGGGSVWSPSRKYGSMQ